MQGSLKPCCELQGAGAAHPRATEHDIGLLDFDAVPQHVGATGEVDDASSGAGVGGVDGALRRRGVAGVEAGSDEQVLRPCPPLPMRVRTLMAAVSSLTPSPLAL